MAVGLLLVVNRQSSEEPSDAERTEEADLIATATPFPTPVPTDRVVVAQQRIPRGTVLMTDTIPLSEWISLEDWPQGWVTRDALTSFGQVEGKIARADIPRGTILMADMLTEQAGDLLATGSDAALLIPPDRVAVAIPVDHLSSVGWSLRRGDHVDVLISFLMIEVDDEFQTELPNRAASLVKIEETEIVSEEGIAIKQGTLGRIEQDPFGQPINVIPSESHQRPRLISQVTVRDAEVLNVGPWGELFGALAPTSVTFATTGEGEEGEGEGSSAEGDETGGTSPQQVEILVPEGLELTEDEILREYLNASTHQPLLLIVTPQNALVLKWADEAGAALHVVLRSHEDAGVSLPDTEAVTLQYMVDRFNMALPPGLEFGVEPAAMDLERSFLKLPEQLWNPWSTQPTQTGAPPRQ
jgi:Flp pilus assembly protein CpaB